MVAALFLDAKNKNTSAVFATSSSSSSSPCVVHHLVDYERRRSQQYSDNPKLMKMEEVIMIWFQIPFESCFGGDHHQYYDN